MSENFNVSPYYDDFDPAKNYHRILFKPGYSVQARELTQSQTILQNQISNFAQNIFQQNTPISGGRVTTNMTCSYVKLLSTYSSYQIDPTSFLNSDGTGRYITNQSTTLTDGTVIPQGAVVAKVITVVEGTTTTPPTLIVSYLSGSHFVDGMSIQTNDTNTLSYATTIGTLGGTTCTGFSSTASISDGVFYVVNPYTQNTEGVNNYIGHFVQVNQQTIILDAYDNTPSYRVGLLITENIINYTEDSSLLDPAIGASNYQAPGADRYQITLTLATLPIQFGTNDSNFIELLRVVNGKIVSQVDGTVYSTIDDYFAKRDYETNGDYLIQPYTFTPSSNTINSAQYDLTVSKGVAYVHGYRIENQSPLKLTSDRARTVNTANNNQVIMDVGSYFYVDTVNGFFNVATMPQIDLHCVPGSYISNTSNIAYNSTKIGTAFIRNLIYVQDSGAANTWVYKAYVSDINVNSTTYPVSAYTGTNTITLVDPNNTLSTTAVSAYLGFVLTVISGTSAGDVRQVTYSNGKQIVVDKPFTVNPDSTSVIRLTPSVGSVETLVLPSVSGYGIASSLNINSALGKQNGLNSGLAILENSASPEMIFKIGNPYVASVSGSTYQSTKTYTSIPTGSSGTFTLNAGTNLNFNGIAGTTQSSSIIKQFYVVIDSSTGLILDYTIAGSTVSLDSGKQNITFTSPSYANRTVNVVASVFVVNGDIPPVMKWKNLVYGSNTVITTNSTSVTGDANTIIDLQLGQSIIKYGNTGTGKISLRVADIRNIVAIYDTGSPSILPATNTLATYTNVTNLYTFDNGQRDNYYDHASIKLLAGANAAAGNLLVIYNYYSHINGNSNLGTGTASDGYFSPLSYSNSSNPDTVQNIPVYKAKSGTYYKLSDCLDFRPSRVNGTTSLTFEFASTGTLQPVDLSYYTSNYSYYLGRKDLLVLSKDKSFQIIEGTPALNPIYPSQPAGTILLANLTLDPYTVYLPNESPSGSTPSISINSVPHNRWAKSDITDLQTRVNNLEYYASMSVLEQNANALQVPDANGLNRFKNGILVDGFSDYGTADTSNPDFVANINIRKQTLGPLAIIDNIQLQNPIVTSALGTLSNTNTFAVSSLHGTGTNIFTLPYTTSNLALQPFATSDVSLNPFSVTVYQGTANLFPPMDNWVDGAQAPSVLITDPNLQIYQQTAGVNLTNSGDFATIPGTSYSTTSSASYTSHNNAGITAGGISPYGYVGFTETTTQTYASQLTNVLTTQNYTQVNSSLSLNNGYITNISIQPYIRAQQLGFVVNGLKVNSKVSTWFDGQNIDQYITMPNTIEMTNVTGGFSEGDVVGFYAAGVFYPVARVLGVYVYPKTTNMRLYVSDVDGLPTYTTTNQLQNGFYDSNGAYIQGYATGIGTVNGSSRLSSSGTISGVGGGYTISGQTYQLYAVRDSQNWSAFMNSYAIWGDLNRSSSYNVTFTVIPQFAGTYTYQLATTGATTVTGNGSTIISNVGSNYSGSPYSGQFNISNAQVGNPYTLNIVVGSANGSPSGMPGVALIVVDSSGNIVFTTTHPPALTYNNATGESLMPQGGAWFSGVTSLQLDQNATGGTATYYQGAQISVTSTYAYSFTVETATYVPPPAPPSGGGGGGSIICAKLARLGYFDTEMNEADQKFGLELRATDPHAYHGYLRWAKTVVALMDGKGSKRLRQFILPWVDDAKRIEIQKRIVIGYVDILARPWAEEMAFRMGSKNHTESNFVGKMIMDIGLPICRKIGKTQTNKKMPLPAKIILIWSAVTVLIAFVTVISFTDSIIKKVKNFVKGIFKYNNETQAINS